MSASSHSCPIIHANCPTGALTLPYGVWATANDCVGWPSTMHYVLNLNLIYTSTIISHITLSVGMQSFQTTLKLSDQPESGTYSLLYLIATFYTILVQGKCSHPFLHPYTLHRFLRFFAVKQPDPLSRVRRQGGSCQTNADCLPSGVSNISSDLVSCVAGQCLCMDCFMSDDDSGRCRRCNDYPYDPVLRICGRDDRPRQLTAFLLSLFLSSTGAANFYIGQDGLGKAHLL